MSYISFISLYNASLRLAAKKPATTTDAATEIPCTDAIEEENFDDIPPLPWTKMLEQSPAYRRKYRLWEETQGMCIYCGKSIQVQDFVNGVDSDIEHIIPQAIGGTSTLDNLICSCRDCNRDKGSLTAIDFMLSKSSDVFQLYMKRIRLLMAARLISREKYINLTRPKLIPLI